jgi:signal transduction histidine kinase
MSLFGFLVALSLFCHFNRRWRYRWRRGLEEHGGWRAEGPMACSSAWPREWAEHGERRAGRDARRMARRAERDARRFARRSAPPGEPQAEAGRPGPEPRSESEALARARRRAAAEAGFYGHLLHYLGWITLLALINLFTSSYPWFIWPALGWGIGVFSHYMAVFGSRMLKERYFDRAVERELRRERATMQTEKQASIDELSSSIAHEIRNPIAAAKSLVQQMGEDPTSVENVEYARVALAELDRVEHRVSHLLRYAKEEDYQFALVNLASVVDSALTQLRAKLDAAKVAVSRNYIAGPTVQADAEKLRQVFANVLDNAIDALGTIPEGRRIDLFLENGDRGATVRLRDNGCGIPPDKIDRIFNPFFTTKEKGTGLGMAISKKIVEAHQGSIDVKSEVGRGTEFRITLPLPARS